MGKLQTEIDYELKIDAQVEKFFEIKQKLTYFLITASIAVMAFLVNFAITHLMEAKQFIWIVIISSIAGFFTSGFSLLNLHLEHRSYRLHIKYRYEKKEWDSLSDMDKNKWELINKWAARSLKSAFIFLFIEITFTVIFFVLFLYLSKGIMPGKGG